MIPGQSFNIDTLWPSAAESSQLGVRGVHAAALDMSVSNTPLLAPPPPPLRRSRSSLALKTETGREREALR